MIRAYKLNLKANKRKIEKILEVAKEYRKTGKVILKTQLNLLFREGKLNKNYKLELKNTKLSARYLQTLQYQVVSMLKSYLSNRENDFKEIVSKSNLDEKTKIKLFYINKYQKWFFSEIKMKNEK